LPAPGAPVKHVVSPTSPRVEKPASDVGEEDAFTLPVKFEQQLIHLNRFFGILLDEHVPQGFYLEFFALRKSIAQFPGALNILVRHRRLTQVAVNGSEA
jgi:hypothetical protein